MARRLFIFMWLALAIGSTVIGGAPLAAETRERYRDADRQSPGSLSAGDVYTVVDQIGGRAYSAIDVGGYLYVGGERKIAVVDVADPAAIHVAGTSALLPIRPELMRSDGQTVVVASTDHGIVVLDVADPLSPAVVRHIDAADARDIDLTFFDFAVRDGRVYAPSPGSLQIIDFAEGPTPQLIGSLAAGQDYFLSVAVVGDYAFVGGSDVGGRTPRLRVVDVSSPEEPILVGSVDAPGAVRAVVPGDSGDLYMYTVGRLDGPVLCVVDVNNPAVPRIVARAGGLTSPTVGSDGTDGRRAVSRTGAPDGGSPRRSLAIPMVTDVYPVTRLLHHAGHILVGDSTAGFGAVDVRDPARPRVVTALDGMHDGRDVAALGERIYIPTGRGLLWTVAAGTSQHPVFGSFYMPHSGFILAVLAHESLIYDIAYDVDAASTSLWILRWRAESSMLEVLSTTTLRNGVQTIPDPDLALLGDVLLVAGVGERLAVMDVSQPTMPIVKGWHDFGDARRIETSGGFAYIAGRAGALSVVALDGQGVPRTVATLALSSPIDDLSVRGHRLIAAGAYPAPAVRSAVSIVDVSTASAPSPIARLEVADRLGGVDLVGDVAYLAGSGLHVVDISDPATPQVVSSPAYQLRGDTDSVAHSNRCLFVGVTSAVDSRLYAFDLASPLAPVLASGSSAYAAGLATDHGLVYVAGGASGLHAIRVDGCPDATPDASPTAKWTPESTPTFSTPNTTVVPSPTPTPESTLVPSASPTPPRGFELHLPLALRNGQPLPVDPGAEHARGEVLSSVGGIRPSSIALGDDLAFMSVGLHLFVLDISDLLRPRIRADIDLKDEVRDSAFSQGYLYVALRRAGLVVVDAASSSEVAVVAGLQTTGETTALAVDGSTVFIASADEGILAVDIANPRAVRVRYRIPDIGPVTDMATAGGFLYVTSVARGLVVIDAGADAAIIRGAVAVADPLRLAIDRESARVLVLSSNAGPGGEDVVEVYDVSAPPDPVHTGSFSLPCVAYDIAAVGDAYVACSDMGSGYSGSLRAFDVSEPNAAQLRSTVPFGEAAVALAVRSDAAVAATMDGGLHVVGIAAPGHLSELGTFGTDVEVLRVAVDGDTAYLGTRSHGLRLVDMGDAARPRQLGGVDLLDRNGSAASAGGVAVRGDTVFVASGRNLFAVDVADRQSPNVVAVLELKSPYELASVAQALAVDGGRAYVASLRTLFIVDVTDRAEMKQLGVARVSGVGCDVAVEGDTVFVAGGLGGLQLYDVSHPAVPVLRSTLQRLQDGSPAWADGVAVRGTVALVVAGSAGLRLVDVSDGDDPRELGHASLRGNAVGVWFLGADTAVVAAEDDGVRFVDIARPDEAREIAWVDTPGQAVDVALAHDVAYVADSSIGESVCGGVREIDVRTPAAPRPLGVFFDPARTWGGVAVAVSGPMVHVASGAGGGFHIVDASRATHPMTLGSVRLPGRVASSCSRGETAFVGAEYYLRMMAVSDASKPIERGMYLKEGGIESVACDGDIIHVVGGDYRILEVDATLSASLLGVLEPTDMTQLQTAQDIAVADGFAYIADLTGKLVMVDVSDVRHPTEVASVDVAPNSDEPTAVGVAVADGVAYVAAGTAGLVLVDIRDPRHAERIASVTLPGAASSVAIRDAIAYVTVGSEAGLRRVDVTDVRRPVELEPLRLPGDPTDVWVTSDTIYVAAGWAGLLLVQP